MTKAKKLAKELYRTQPGATVLKRELILAFARGANVATLAVPPWTVAERIVTTADALVEDFYNY